MHLQRRAQNTGFVDELLEPVELPRCVSEVWETFKQLSRTRLPSMGTSPITHGEIRAWCENYGTRLSPWELDVILELDAVTLSVLSKKGGQE